MCISEYFCSIHVFFRINLLLYDRLMIFHFLKFKEIGLIVLFLTFIKIIPYKKKKKICFKLEPISVTLKKCNPRGSF